jgi:hypothetical protein
MILIGLRLGGVNWIRVLQAGSEWRNTVNTITFGLCERRDIFGLASNCQLLKEVSAPWRKM